ncbi:MAG: hypothetical protein K2L86_10390 [Lachnospiraceae bacterium]|nr:hypothetical protein [Lachnospiraceae bacterium]
MESGLYQTGISYPYSKNSEFDINHVDGSIIEFYPNYSILESKEGIKLKQYELVEVKVRLKNEEK